MPDPEPRVDSADAAPGDDPVSPESEQPTLFSAADAPTTEAVVDHAETPAEEQPAPEPAVAPDEWEPAEPDAAKAVDDSAVAATDGPAEVVADVPDATVYDTGVLEIVASLDDEAPADAGTPDAPAETADAETPPEVPAETAEPSEAAEAADATPVVEPAVQAEVEPEAPARARVPWWPFVVYLSLWVVGLGVGAYQLMQVPEGQALYEQTMYGYFVLGGLVLTALGPLLIPFIWLLARHGVEKGRRGGLFVRTAFWCALSTLAGVALWWLTIMVLDAVRLGSAL